MISMLSMIPRAVYFSENKAVGAGFAAPNVYDAVFVINLPTDHYDFIGPISCIGKSKEEIEKEAMELYSAL